MACLAIGVALSLLASSSMKGVDGTRRTAACAREKHGNAASAALPARKRRRETDIDLNGLDGARVRQLGPIPIAAGSDAVAAHQQYCERDRRLPGRFPNECCFQVIYFVAKFFFCKARGTGPARWRKPVD
jgi:hypothetical protein